MSEHNDDSFRGMNKKQKLRTVAGITLILVLVLGFIIGIYLFGMAGVFKLLRVQYTSVWSLLVFVVSFFILSAVIELISKPMSDLLAKKVTKKLEALFIEFSMQSLSNWLCLSIVDLFMDSVSLSWKTGLIVAVLLTTFEMVFEDKANKNES
ncbi:regulatory YrvL family protein [Oceanobacillus sp. J11TS1]|uniref:regulatory YrvL family protein n=1 Tax=Oceanobacillus sp. J11TS1 TaxID=2807191 RepID=UPI001AFDCA40|nr:regulatory YrvL family protein [Oceanobacillus sp. J11TS1]GIO23285.1 hypothetical protein J11TS1_18660 [Oceanobacillus sp. J11TS1]